jgi:hypothetical protein
MGAASSMLNIDIYISYPEKTKYIDCFENNLKSLNYNIINSSLLKNSIKEIPILEAEKYIKIIIEKTCFLIIGISSQSIKSYSQSIELNELIENNSFDKQKIIYLLLEHDYLPNNNKSLENFLKNKRWFPFYNEETYSNSIDKLLSIIFST